MPAWLTDSPWAIPLAVVAAVVLLYLGRSAAHEAIRALFRALSEGLLAADRLVMGAQEKLVKRNREVLLSAGREVAERTIEREFHRVGNVVERDLGGYPALHRKLSDQIQMIDEDYRQSTEVPPSPPEWVKAVESIATIVPRSGDGVVGKILGDVHRTLEKSHHEAMKEYRSSSRGRHKLLQRMLPYWRKLDRTLERVDSTIHGLGERSQVIDGQMRMYEEIREGADHAAQSLHSSSMTHFVTSFFVLVIAMMGAFINFHLIALPMSEMVGATSHVGGMMVSDIAALVIIMTEVAMGLFLMESLRITRLFPVIHTMDDQMRRRMIWVSFTILTTLACVEASLAYMRDLLAADREALTQALAGSVAVDVQLRWIPSLGQMVMGFMLPFALCFAAIPLESFIQSSRTVFGSVAAVLMRSFAALLRIVASLCESAGSALVHLYDFVIVIPLRIEQMFVRRAPTARPQEMG
jgi:hypothetical protein